MRKTMFIGLGGFGIRVVAKLKKYAARLQENNEKIYAVAIDSDDHDLNQIAAANDIPQVSLSAGQRVRELLLQYHGLGVDEWFPASPMLLHSETFSTGVRAVGRLCFLHAKESGLLEQLRELLEVFMENSQGSPRIVVVTSLCGGIGSGMFIQLAVWLRNLVRAQWNVNPRICGMFAGPEMFIRTRNPSISQCERFRANAYSALRELEMFTEIAETGNAPAGYPDFFLDGINLARNGPMPIYDHMSLYEPAEQAQATFETHLDRMAGSAWLWLQTDLDLLITGQIRDGSLRFMTLGAAVAQYPEKEILEYCSIRGALELVSNGWENQQLTEDQVNYQVEQIISRVEKVVEKVLEPEDQILDLGELLEKRPTTNQEVEEYTAQLLHTMKIRIAEHSEVCEKLKRLLTWKVSHIFSSEHRDTIRSMFMACDGEQKQILSPATLKKVLQKLVQEMNTLQEKQLYLLQKQKEERELQVPVPVPPALVDVAPSNPEQVWKEIPQFRKMLPGSKTRKRYLDWLQSYCEVTLHHHRQLAKTALYGFLLRLLGQECEGLLRAGGQLQACLNDSLQQLRARNVEQEDDPGTIRLCVDTEGKEGIYQELRRYVSEIDGSEFYFRTTLGIYTEGKWPGVTENVAVSTQIREACKELLQQFRDALLSRGKSVLHMEATEALRHYWGIAMLDRICRQLPQKAKENGGYMLERAPAEEEAQIAVLYVSDACDCRTEIDNILQNMPSIHAESHGIDPALMWCMLIRWNIPLEQTTMESWAEAYNWLCQRAKNSGEEHFTPHMDKNWAEQIFGLQ